MLIAHVYWAEFREIYRASGAHPHCNVESDVQERRPVRVAGDLQPLHRRESAVRVSPQLRAGTAKAESRVAIEHT